MGKKEGDGSARNSSSLPGRIIHRTMFSAFVIVALCLLSYSNTFHASFAFDDEPAITDNRLVKDIGNFLASTAGYSYNPRRYVAYLTFALNYRVGGLDVTGYHAFNIVVHIVNALLVFTLVRQTFRTPFLKGSGLAPSAGIIAFVAAILFAVHPVQTQAVTYIVQRMTSLATLFSLASLCLYARWRIGQGSGERRWSRSAPLYATSLICLVLAMRTKEISFTIPVLIALYDRFFFGGTKVKQLVPFLLTLFLIPVEMLHFGKPFGEVLSDVSAVTRVKSELSRWEYLLTQVTVIVTYLRLLVFPVNQNLDYDYPIMRSLFSGPVILSALILLSILSLGTFLYLRSRPEGKNPLPAARLVSFGIAWFFITLLVESSIIPIADVIFEHRIYLPSAGFFIALSVGIIACGTRLERKNPGIGKAFVAFIMLAAAVLAVATFLRNQTWKDETSLWMDVVNKSPRKGRPYYNLALAYDRNGNLPEAMRYYIASLSLDPYNGKARDNLGNIHAKQGRFPEAIREFQAALALDPDDATARNNLGNVYAKMGRVEDALAEYRKALSSDTEYAEAHFNAGIAYGILGDLEQAALSYSKALELDPDHGAAHNNLGLLHARQGRLDEAEREFRAAVEIDPADAEAWNNLGNVHAHRGRYEEAARHFREALRWSPGNPEVHHNLGTAYLRLGRLTEAIAEFQTALRIDPAHAGARRNLAESRNRQSGSP